MASAAASDSNRESRRHSLGHQDNRGAFERDRDRVLYSSAFRRLAGVTQIVRAGEADVFHNRLTHTLKVAQVGRRLAEQCIRNQPSEANHLGVDPDVVEAACLIHDLGHPPFGHVGETKLNELVTNDGDPDGFEGNAQSFRVVTKLAIRFVEEPGLDLTRATLAASIKYPWSRKMATVKKWGYYESEERDFSFARQNCAPKLKTAEAEIMDWADDIAYSVHDLEDFHRCGAIPWHMIFSDDKREELVQHAFGGWKDDCPSDAAGRLRRAYDRLKNGFFPLVPELVNEPYQGTHAQRQQTRFLTSQLIHRYANSLELRVVDASERCVRIDPNLDDEVRLLKQITRQYVLNNAALAAQQKGYQFIIRQLFEDLRSDVEEEKQRVFPLRYRHLVDTEASPARIVADVISSLSESEALALHGRLRGHASGSVLDPIVR